MTMTSSWLPTWAAALWTVAFLVVAAVHCFHAAVMAGRARVWHAAHVLMALGMVDMYWPAPSQRIGQVGGQWAFALLFVAAIASITIDARRRHPPVWLAAMTSLSLLAMSYMFVMASHRDEVVSLVLTAWFAVEAVGWLSGALSGVAWRSGLGLPVRNPGPRPVLVPARVARDAHEVAAVEAEPRRIEQRMELAIHDPVFSMPMRLSLTLMSVGMGYMILVMQFGGAFTATMPPMPGM